MEYENIIISIVLMMVGLVMAAKKKAPRFARAENEIDGELIHWFKVEVGGVLSAKVRHLIIGTSQDLEAVFGYRMPERFLKDNRMGAVVSFDSEIPNGDWPFQKALLTQSTLIWDLVEILQKNGSEWQDGSQMTGKGTKADPEVNHELDIYSNEDAPSVRITHSKSSGSRTRYEAKEVQSLD